MNSPQHAESFRLVVVSAGTSTPPRPGCWPTARPNAPWPSPPGTGTR